MLARFITTLTTTALFSCMATAIGLPGLAVAENSGPELVRGEQLYALCTQCHGADGGGNQAALAPAIAGLPAWYVKAQLEKIRAGIRGLHQGDRGGLRMYPMSQWLRTEEDREAVAAYVASMKPTDTAETVAHSGDVARGQGYYAVCSACHGMDAGGNPQMGAPPLVGLNDWYLISSIEKYKGGIRGNGPGDTLGPAMIGMVATLPDDDAIRDVVAYIKSLKKK